MLRLPIDIDTPANAFTMELNGHRDFDALEIYFDETAIPNKYTVKAVEDLLVGYPKTVTFTRPEGNTTAFPSPEYLRIHKACVLVAHASGAGLWLKDLFDHDEDERTIKADGSTDIGSLLKYEFTFGSGILPHVLT